MEETTPEIMPPTVDEFFALPIQPQAKLVALWLLTRPAQVFNFRVIADALHMHAYDIEQAGLFLLRSDPTPFHPIVHGIPSEFGIAGDHILRDTFDSGAPDRDDEDEPDAGEDVDDSFVPDGAPLPPGEGAAAPADPNTHQPARRRRRKGKNRNV